MARKYLTPIDLNQNELRNAVVQNLGSAPGTPVNGQIFYLTTGGHDLQARVNGAWQSLVAASLLGLANTWTSTNIFNGAVTGNSTINLTGAGASSVGGTFAATVHSATGITGATAASRYVGATASGAPASGTFAVGDYVISQTGDVWVCTGAGTPGTWVRVGSYLLGTVNTWTAAQTFNAAITGNNTINLTGAGASSVGGVFTATVNVSSGLTGAVAASRYVGGVASGAPASGTFVTGDFTIDQTGTVWVCTAGGTPGTWKRVGDYLLGATNAWSASNTFSGGLVANSAVTGNGTIVLTGAGASSVGGTFTATAHIASGLTGATAASRYVGATASGAPGSGTFAVGDYIVTQDAHIFICTSAGSPGTWVSVGTTLTPASSVVADTTFGASSVVGVSLLYARQDHSHGSPTHVGSDHSAISISSLTAPTGDIAWGSHKITGLLDPTGPQDAATKNYVDTVSAGLLWKAPVRAATTTTLPANTYANGAAGVGATLTGNANGALAAVDGQTLGAATSQTITAMTNAGTTVTATVASNANLAVGQIVTVTGSAGFTTNNPNGQWTVASLVGTTQFTFVVNLAPTGSYTASSATAATTADRLLVQNEATGANNGIYVVTQVGTAALPYILTRATDNDTNTDIEAAAVYVESGTVNAKLGFNCTNTGGLTVGTTAITWVAFTGASTATAGAGLTATGNVFAVGAANGITVNADSIQVDTAVVVRKFAQAFGDGVSTSYTITHNLGTQDVTVSVYTNSSTWDEVECDVQHTTTNTCTLVFAVAPTTNQYRVVVHG